MTPAPLWVAGSATAVPAHMIEVCTSSPSRLNWLWFLVPCVSGLVWCSLQLCFYKPDSKFLLLSFEGEGIWKAEHNLESDPDITTAIIRCWIFSIWWWVPLPSASSARLYKCPTFHWNPLSRELWFWHNWLLQKCCKPLHACPSTLRNTCFKFVCLPLPRFSSFPSIPSAWSLGMFTMKLIFQDSSSFLSGNSKSSILFEACSVICIPCLHFSFPLPLQRKAGDSRSEALGI